MLWLAQNTKSPIVKHRHALWNYVRERQDLRLIVAVGKAAKESVHTWVKSRGGACPSGAHDVSQCDASVIGPHTRIVGVVHPGAGGQGASTSAIIADFKKALAKIDGWAADDASWLPVDPGGTRAEAATFRYRSAPIPFRDLPYGVAWRIGQGGTSSNRKDAQRSIQMFSEDGSYGGSSSYNASAGGSNEGYAQEAGDLAYEPPKHSFGEFDAGPEPPLARLMMGGDPGLAWPDFTALGATAHPSFGYGPIYRGRPSQARILVLADQESHDDLFMFRALTGDAGQRLQQFLHAMGITASYAILRVLPIDTLGLAPAKVDAIVDHAQVRQLYRAIVERIVAASSTALALVVGPYAQRLSAHVMPAGLATVEMKAWKESGALANWKQALQQIKTKTLHEGSRVAEFFVERRARPDPARGSAVRHAAVAGNVRRPRPARLVDELLQGRDADVGVPARAGAAVRRRARRDRGCPAPLIRSSKPRITRTTPVGTDSPIAHKLASRFNTK